LLCVLSGKKQPKAQSAQRNKHKERQEKYKIFIS